MFGSIVSFSSILINIANSESDSVKKRRMRETLSSALMLSMFAFAFLKGSEPVRSALTVKCSRMMSGSKRMDHA